MAGYIQSTIASGAFFLDATTFRVFFVCQADLISLLPASGYT